MALTLRRRRIDPMPRRDLERAMRGDADPIGTPADDYLVEGDEEPPKPSAAMQVAQLAQVVLIAVIAVLSLGVFWLLGTLFDVL